MRNMGIWRVQRLVRLLILITGGFCSLLATTLAEEPSLLIQNAMIFDATGKAPYLSDVLVIDGRIAAIDKTIENPAPGIETIDAEGLSLLPGLIDVHVHWTSADNMTRASTATALLLSGVTTSTDFHSAPESYAPKRTHHEMLVSPHVFYIARMSTPGGHGAGWTDQNMTRTVLSERDARAGVNAIRPYKPDGIKAFSDGWRYGSGVDNTSMNENALTAIVEEANAFGAPVLTHTVTVERAKIAARSKVSAIVHAIQDNDADQELVDLMKENGVIYAPTLAVYEPREDKLARITSEDVLARTWKRQRHSKQNLKLFAENGVTIALGTDAGIASTPMGESSLRELELLVEFGLSPTEALIAGTANSAAALRLQDDRGTIEVGKRADFVLVKGAPWKQISDYRKLEYVFVDGQPVAKNGVLLVAQGEARPNVKQANRLIDDFEREDGKTAADAARFRSGDTSHPRAAVVIQTVPRGGKGKALLVSAEMAMKDNPRVFVNLPLSLGGYTPNDVSRFEGVRFDARGDGEYAVRFNTGDGVVSADFDADHKWRPIKIQFSDTDAEADQNLDTLFSIAIGGSREAGEKLWLELDNVEFF